MTNQQNEPREFWIYKSVEGNLIATCLPISFNDKTEVIHVIEAALILAKIASLELALEKCKEQRDKEINRASGVHPRYIMIDVYNEELDYILKPEKERGWQFEQDSDRDAEVAELDSALDLQGKVLRRYTEENEALKQQVEEHNRKEVIFQKELTYLRSVIEECVSEMKKEIKTRDEAIDVAVKALNHIENESQLGRDDLFYKASNEALHSINTLLGREG